jgi:hypothetical protein
MGRINIDELALCHIKKKQDCRRLLRNNKTGTFVTFYKFIKIESFPQFFHVDIDALPGKI